MRKEQGLPQLKLLFLVGCLASYQLPDMSPQNESNSEVYPRMVALAVILAASSDWRLDGAQQMNIQTSTRLIIMNYAKKYSYP
jgi:hypothetical protein